MKTTLLIASGILAVALANAAAPVPALAKSMKECAAEWKQMKAAKQTAGKSYREFSKQCMSGGAAAAPSAKPTATRPAAAKPAAAAPSTAGAPATPPAKAKKSAGKVSPGRQAMIARDRACGKEWKADKAAGKVPAGMKWPQYWSACNKRKKAEGM